MRKARATAAIATPTKTPTTFPVSAKKPLGVICAAWMVTEAAGGADGVIVTVCTMPVTVMTEA